MNADIYAQQLQQVYDVLPGICQLKMCTPIVWWCPTTYWPMWPSAKLRKLEELEMLPPHIYNPELPPSEYHIFWAMAHLLHEWKFNTFCICNLLEWLIKAWNTKKLLTQRSNNNNSRKNINDKCWKFSFCILSQNVFGK